MTEKSIYLDDKTHRRLIRLKNKNRLTIVEQIRKLLDGAEKK